MKNYRFRLRPWLWLVLALPLIAQAKEMHRYSVRVEPDLRGLEVRACFAAPRPEYLRAYDRQAKHYLRRMSTQGGAQGRQLKPRGNRLRLDRIGSTGACTEYAVDLSAAGPLHRHNALSRVGGDLLLSPQLWLWYPDDSTSDPEIEIVFKLPPGMAVSAPWPLVERSPHQTVYHVRRRPLSWNARMALGRFNVIELPVSSGQLRIALLDGTPSTDPDAVKTWIEEGARAITTLYGQFPVSSVQVLVVPIGPDSEPVPWGQVMRGGGDALHLYVDQTRPLKEFRKDWTLVHELSHLLLPRLDSRDAWLSEGLASYFQNVLRARAGMLTPAAAWNKLHAGFQRGIRGTPEDRTLAQATGTMMRDRLFMRVYWSGAAVALLADEELRRRTAGKRSLGTTLAKLQACCLPSDRLWTGEELMNRLDELSALDVFTRLYSRHVDSNAFPDLTQTYRLLGIDARSRELRFREDAPMAEIRRAIMGPPRDDT